MRRLPLAALLAAACAQAQAILPVGAAYDLPDYLLSRIEVSPVSGVVASPWICVLPPPIDFDPVELDKDGEIDPYEPIIAGPCEPWIDGDFGAYIFDQSADGDVTLGFNYFTGQSVLNRLSTGERLFLPMIPASALVPEGAIAPAVMVELNPSALSGDGSTVVGNVSWGHGNPFRARPWEGERVELLELDGASWESANVHELNHDGTIVVGSAANLAEGRELAVRWDAEGKLTSLNPLLAEGLGSSARLVTPDGSHIAGDVFNYGTSGIVPFLWSEGGGFLQLGDPLASDDQVIVETLSDDGAVLTGQRYEADGDTAAWYWTAEEGFKDIEIVICDFEGEITEDYTLTGIDPLRRIFLGTLADGSQFLSFDGVTISTAQWMGTVSDPVGTLRSAMGLSGQAMEGAHHRPIGQLALPGKASFAWFTGDIGKAWKERDAEQVSGEIGYGFRLGTDGVLGLAFGYSDIDRDSASGSGESRGAFAVVDLGLVVNGGDLTLTAFHGRTDVSTIRNESLGETQGDAYSLRVRYDTAAVGKLGGAPLRPFASLTYDHATIDGYAETGGIAPAVYDDRSQDSWVARLGVSGKLGLGQATDLIVTAEVAHVLGEDRPDFTGTDVGTGVLDFAVPDVRGRETWGRLGLDLDHRLSPDTVLSLTLHTSTRGDAFDVAGALSVRKGF